MIGIAGGRNRAPFAVAAWAGATAVASAVAWLGVDSVLIPAAETPPAVLAAGAHTTPALTITLSPPPPSAASPAPSLTPAPPSGNPGLVPGAHVKSPPASPSATASTSASTPPTPSPTASLSRYETAGGVVVLAIGAHVVTLVSATPAAGYSVQNWGAPGWLRVDFSEGSTTYSVFATWNGYSPQVQVVGPSPSA